MKWTRVRARELPIPFEDILTNKTELYADGKLTVVEITTIDHRKGVGMCRMSDEDLRNPKFRPNPKFAVEKAHWKAADSIRRQREGEEIHDPLMR